MEKETKISRKRQPREKEVEIDFLKHTMRHSIQTGEFLKEFPTKDLLHILNKSFRVNIIRNWRVAEIVSCNTFNVVFRWKKRENPLTDDELKKIYGIDVWKK